MKPNGWTGSVPAVHSNSVSFISRPAATRFFIFNARNSNPRCTSRCPVIARHGGDGLQ
jgi:hypothetical protein